MIAYQPKHPEGVIIHKASPVVVSVGWSDREKIHSQISTLNYAALGNCYSVAGVMFILRNLAHNYQITHLIHMARLPLDANVDTTNSLKEIWGGGVCPGLPDSVTRAVTSRVKLTVVKNLSELKEELLRITEFPPVETQLYPELEYPIELPEVSVTPNQTQYQSGFLIRGNSILDGWVDALKLVRQNGTEIGSHHGVILDIGNLQVTVPMADNLSDLVIPKHLTRESLEKYILTVTNSDQVGDSYTYGQRIGNQLEREVSVFKRNPNHNRSVISLWDKLKDFDSQNPPCLISIGFKIRGNKIYCHALFRSQDIGSGWFPNTYALNALANKFRFLLGDDSLSLGTITITSESAHIYRDALPPVDSWISDNSRRGLQLDPVGDFVVKVSLNSVTIDHYDRSGIYRNSYPNPSAILRDKPAIYREHYGYLSGEFARAQILGEKFRQDRY